MRARTSANIARRPPKNNSISIVDVPSRRVVATLRVVDEPNDVVFAGGMTFVTAATTDKLHVFDASTRASLSTIDVFGKAPRALATSADTSSHYRKPDPKTDDRCEP